MGTSECAGLPPTPAPGPREGRPAANDLGERKWISRGTRGCDTLPHECQFSLLSELLHASHKSGCGKERPRHINSLFETTKKGRSIGTPSLTVPRGIPNRSAGRQSVRFPPFNESLVGYDMISTFADPFDALLSLQRALEAQLTSDWLQDSTASRGAFPPINVFQQGQDLLAIIELPGIDKNDLQIQAKENTIRISGKKVVAFPDGVSVHRRERIVGEFDRTLSLPVRLDPSRIKAEYTVGILALYLPRAESDKPRTIAIN
jgi:HSP20 family protein